MSEAITNTAPETLASEAAGKTEARKVQPQEAVEGLTLAVPEALRSAAEQVVSRTRDTYERTRDAMEETVETLEKSLDKAGQGAAAINRKVIDITQANVNSGFDLAKDVAGARNIAELVELQSAYLRKQVEAFASQAEQIRDLSAQVATDAAEPIKAHMARSIKALHVN